MNKQITCLLLGTMLLAFQSPAQKKQFSITEATLGMATTLAPKSVKSPSWQPGTAHLWQAGKKNKADIWTSADISMKGDTFSAANLGVYNGKTTTISTIKWLDHDHVYAINDKEIILGTLSGHDFSWNSWVTLPQNADHITVDKSKKIAYTVGNNLYLYDKETIPVTAESNKDMLCGSSVHRDEFGIDHGIFFSPKGNYLAYYRMDQSMVSDYPIINWDVMPAKAENIKYPMAGGTSHQVTLCVFDPATRKTVVMKTGTKEKDHYLTCVTWSPDEQYIYIAILNRDQNHLWLNKYNAHTGEKIKTLFEERDSRYVHPTHSLTFLPRSNNQFIWWSQRSGYEHLYLYNTDGTLLHRLTWGKWDVNELAGIDAGRRKLIITAAKESPLEKHIYAVDIDKSTIKRIDNGAGMHSALCNEDGKFVLDVHSGPGTPKTTTVYATDGSSSREIMKSPDPLADYDRPEIRNVTIKAADGVTKLYGKLILPSGFDSTKKYPVIVYLYNGPNVQLIHNSFPESGNLWYEYMAQHGYIVFTMDGRGSDNRGMDFEQATFGKLGEVEMKDQLRGVDYLKSLKYVDANKMGVHGWSFGGFMTTSLMLKYPDVFKCAVAGGPVMDWSMYEVMYTERYMNTPKTNPKGYASTALYAKVKNLKGKLLLIHGTNDNVVVWQHSINFLKNCVNEGVQVDYFVYPGYEHNVRGKDRVHLMQKITDYFDEHLKK